MSSPKPPSVVQTYQPPNQAQAAGSYLSNTNAMQPYAQQTMTDLIPGYQSMLSGYANNPYFGGAMNSAMSAGNAGVGTVGPLQLGGMGSLYGLGNMASGMAGSQNDVLGGASGILGNIGMSSLPMNLMNPQTMGQLGGNLGQATGAMGAGLSAMPDALANMNQGAGNSILGMGQATLPGLFGNVNSSQPQNLLNTAMSGVGGPMANLQSGQAGGALNNFMNAAGGYMGAGSPGQGFANSLLAANGPNSAQSEYFKNQSMAGPAGSGYDVGGKLYNQSYSQALDQANAISAMYGTSNSPYGASMTANAMNSFNSDWQNMLQQRQAQAQQMAYEQAQTSLANEEAQWLNTNNAVQDYATLTGANTGAATSLANTGANVYSGLTGANTSAIAGLMGAGTGAYGNIMGANTGALGNVLGSTTGAYSGLQGSNVGALSSLLGASSGAAGTDLSGLTGLTNSATSGYGNILGSTVGAYGGMVDPSLATLSGLGGMAGSMYGAGSGLGTAGLNTIAQSGSLPYQTYTGNLSNIGGALGQYASGAGAAMAPGMDINQALAQYLGIGQQAASGQNSANLQNYQAQVQAANQLWSGLGGLIGSGIGAYAGLG